MHFDDNVAVVHFDDDVAVVQFDDDVAVVHFGDDVDRRCPFLQRAFGINCSILLVKNSGINCSILLVKKSVVQKTLDGRKRMVDGTFQARDKPAPPFKASLFTKGLRFRRYPLDDKVGQTGG